MVTSPAHLIERAAERLRAESGLVDAPAQIPPTPQMRQPPNLAPGVAQNPAAGPSGGQRPVIGRTGADVEHAHTPLGAASGVGTDGPLADGVNDGAAPPRMVDLATLERTGLVVGRKARTRISEEFRIAVGHVLRTLHTSYNSGQGAANLVLVTSSRPGEGKSFTALNLAGCIAQQDQRDVILVDIDAKQRPLTYDLGLGDAPGLLDLVREQTLRIEDVIVPTAIPSLSILPIGSRINNNAEMTLSRPITAVVERIARRFANRVIILDAPPCLSASDPSALAPIVGQALMVVEAERTQRNELEAALELIRVCPTITLLLNKIRLTTSYTFGAYHYFGSYS